VDVAFFAACMLFLQALVTGLSLGASAASPLLDAFGNPLCLTSVDGDATGSDHGGHGGLPNCCTSACSMFAQAAPCGSAGPSLPNPIGTFAFTLRPIFEAPAAAFAPQRSPGSPRAPPLMLV